MDITPIVPLSSLVPAPQVVDVPRAVDAGSAQQFRDYMSAPDCASGAEACVSEPPQEGSLRETLDMDIEKVLVAHMPAANSSPAEFAVGMLRAQVKVSQAAIAIEMVSKTTQSLSQGVQTLTTRS